MSDVTKGVLVYDVPDGAMKLYGRLRRLICWKHALMVNKSVYLIDWGSKAQIDEIIKDAMEETGEKADISMLPFDASSDDELKDMAIRAMNRMLTETKSRLKKRIEKAKLTIDAKIAAGEEVPNAVDIIRRNQKRILSEVKRRLQQAEGLALVFGFTGEIEAAFEAVKETLSAEMEAVDPDKAERRRKKSAVKSEEEVIP